MNNIIYFKNTKEKKYQGGDNMCTIIERLHNKTPDAILTECGMEDILPIDLTEILKYYNLSALSRDLTILKCGKQEILGLVRTKGNNAAIFYQENMSIHRNRFTIAHEIAHICLHLDPSNNYDEEPYYDLYRTENDETEEEKQADIFAGELLIPLKKLKEVYLSLEIPRSDALAEIFGVSNNVMKKRLEYLKVSYYNEIGQAVRMTNNAN